MDKKFIFICGCPRSGTSALCNLANGHPAVCVGMERYYYRILRAGTLVPEMFEPSAFINYSASDSFWPDLPQRGPIEAKIHSATHIGEKLPYLYERFDLIESNFPAAQTRVLMIFRDPMEVAESYTRRARNANDSQWGRQKDWRVAVSDWNNALRSYLQYRHRLNILPVRYSDLFYAPTSEAVAATSAITEFLGLAPFDAATLKSFEKRFFNRSPSPAGAGALSEQERLTVEQRCDAESWREVCKDLGPESRL
jgi:hypothetical protein